MRSLFFIVLLNVSSLFGQTDTLRIYFSNNSDVISDSAMSVISSNTDSIISIHSYCDRNGSVPYNEQLAKKRVDAVLSLMDQNATQYAEIHIFGEEYPIAPANYHHSEWRRVDIIVKRTPILVDQAEPMEQQESLLVEQLTGFISDSTISEKTIELTIQFYPGLPIVLPEYEGQLFVLFDFLRYNGDVSAEIHGHVCCADDYPLSYQRAHVVYQFLIDRTISPQRLKYRGFSNSRPKVTPELTDLDRQQNRRVEVVVRKNEL